MILSFILSLNVPYGPAMYIELCEAPKMHKLWCTVTELLIIEIKKEIR